MDRVYVLIVNGKIRRICKSLEYAKEFGCFSGEWEQVPNEVAYQRQELFLDILITERIEVWAVS